MKKEIDEDEEATKNSVDSVPFQIAAFASKLGEDTGGKFSCYVYRVIRDPETGRVKKPFIKKYVGVEPDPFEIAEKHRGGTYLVQFIWKEGKEQQSKAYTLDVDDDAFPPLTSIDKSHAAIIPQNLSGFSEQMQLQLVMIREFADVMKEAYKSGGSVNVGGSAVQTDPMEMFSGMMEQMETAYSRSMAIQSKIMERVFTKNMEKRYGLTEEPVAGEGAASPADDQSVIAKYAPVVREIVDGLKTVFGFFGDHVPKNVVEKVKSDDRFKTLLKDRKAVEVIGGALRKEFGNSKAIDLMRTFGVEMVVRSPKLIANTPEIPEVAKKAISVGTEALKKTSKKVVAATKK